MVCGRFYIAGTSREKVRVPDLRVLPGNPFVNLDAYLAETPPRNDIRPTQLVPVVHDGDAQIDEMQWWFVPNLPYVHDPAEFRRKYTTFNARVESLGPKSRMFGSAWKAGQRGLIPMSGYYEWVPIEGQKKKQRYAIAPNDGRLLFAATLWDRWEPRHDGLPLTSCTMIVREAARDLVEIHDRSPFLIPEELAHDWLTVAPERAMEMLHAIDLPKLEGKPVPGPIAVTV